MTAPQTQEYRRKRSALDYLYNRVRMVQRAAYAAGGERRRRVGRECDRVAQLFLDCDDAAFVAAAHRLCDWATRPGAPIPKEWR